MPKKRKNRGKQRTQKKPTTTNDSIQANANDGTNESDSIEYINENEKLKNVIARLENKLQESVVKTEMDSTDLPKCANTINESSSVAKSSTLTVVQNTKAKIVKEENETAAPSSCSVDGSIVFRDPSSSLVSVNNADVKNYYKCNFCDFKLERIFENRKKLLEHLRTHKFPSIELEIQKKRKADEEIALQKSNTEIKKNKKFYESNEKKIYAEQSTMGAIFKNTTQNSDTSSANEIVKLVMKRKQPTTIASIQRPSSSSTQLSSENNNIEESSIDAYYSSMDKRKNRSMPYIVCKICNIKFTHKSSYIRHKISQHSNQKLALNPRTGEPFDAKQKICTECNQVFSRESVLNQHISTVHYGLKPYECEYCKRKFSAKSNLFEHVRTHTRERPYNCEYCKTTFPYRSTLTTHIKNVHKNIIGDYKPPESNFRCKYCQADFPNYSQRYRHLKQVHQITTTGRTDPLDIQNIGSIIEIEDNNVEIHSVYVDQTNDIIEVCDDQNDESLKEEKEEDETFMKVEEEYIEDSAQQYIEENLDQNTNEEEIYEQVTIEENYYEDNMSDIIEEDYLEDVIENLNEQEEYVEYEEEQLENSTSNWPTETESDIDVVNEINQTSSFSDEATFDSKPKNSLEKSKEFKQLINTSKDNIDANEINKLSQDFIDSDDPKKCAKCSTSFSRVAVLHQHIKSVHLQLKPYKCGYCDKKFASRSNLIEHIRLHTGEKPYKCRACDEDFNRRGLFTKHVKIAHPEQIKELLA